MRPIELVELSKVIKWQRKWQAKSDDTVNEVEKKKPSLLVTGTLGFVFFLMSTLLYYLD